LSAKTVVDKMAMHTISIERAVPFHLECGAIPVGVNGTLADVGIELRTRTRDRRLRLN
jgi:hypothetical protein